MNEQNYLYIGFIEWGEFKKLILNRADLRDIYNIQTATITTLQQGLQIREIRSFFQVVDVNKVYYYMVRFGRFQQVQDQLLDPTKKRYIDAAPGGHDLLIADLAAELVPVRFVSAFVQMPLEDAAGLVLGSWPEWLGFEEEEGVYIRAVNN